MVPALVTFLKKIALPFLWIGVQVMKILRWIYDNGCGFRKIVMYSCLSFLGVTLFKFLFEIYQAVTHQKLPIIIGELALWAVPLVSYLCVFYPNGNWWKEGTEKIQVKISMQSADDTTEAQKTEQ